MQNYSYLRPPNKFVKSFKVPSHQPVTGERVIFGGNEVQLNGEETEALHRLREYLKHKNPSKDYNNNLLLRYCYLGQFRTTDSVDRFKCYEQWWSMISTQKNLQKEILHSGVFYCYGKDEQYAPNIYLNPSKINLRDFSIQNYLISLRSFLIPIEEYMLFPGKIQKWNIIVDGRVCIGDKFKQNLSIIVDNLFKILYAYPYRAKKIFLLTPKKGYSGLLSKFWSNNQSQNIIEKIIHELNLESLCIRIGNFKQLDKYIPVDERERQYGGTLDDLCQFWPISSTNKLMEINSKFIEGSEESVEYNSVINDTSFFDEKQEKKILCNLRQYCCIQ